MRKPKTLLKPAAINRTVTSHPAALALSQLLPEIRKHMNHAEELARPHKKRQIPKPREKTMARDTAAPQVPMTLEEGSRLARVVA